MNEYIFVLLLPDVMHKIQVRICLPVTFSKGFTLVPLGNSETNRKNYLAVDFVINGATKTWRPGSAPLRPPPSKDPACQNADVRKTCS